MDVSYSLAASHKIRVGSFDSVDSFDVVSMDESIEECIDMAYDDDDDEHQAMEAEESEWEELSMAPRASGESEEVEIEIGDGYTNALAEALGGGRVVGPQAVASGVSVVATILPPRRRSARETLRDFYLARAKTSETSSKNYRMYEPETTEDLSPSSLVQEEESATAAIPFDVVEFEREKREANTRQAQHALRAFYAQRDAEKARRAVVNRANERSVYACQAGGGGGVAFHAQPPPPSSMESLYWETTRFVGNGNSSNSSSSTMHTLAA